MKNPTTDLPAWGEMPKRPGLYLSLSHGRDFPQQILKKQGFAGPKIGPLLYVKTLYAQQVTLRFANRRDAKRFFPDATLVVNLLDVVEGTLVYADKCYGNWDVCFIAEEFCQSSKLLLSRREKSQDSTAKARSHYSKEAEKETASRKQ